MDGEIITKEDILNSTYFSDNCEVKEYSVFRNSFIILSSKYGVNREIYELTYKVMKHISHRSYGWMDYDYFVLQRRCMFLVLDRQGRLYHTDSLSRFINIYDSTFYFINMYYDKEVVQVPLIVDNVSNPNEHICNLSKYVRVTNIPCPNGNGRKSLLVAVCNECKELHFKMGD